VRGLVCAATARTSWRGYTASAQLTAQRTWADWALRYLYTFRAVVVGTCLVLAVVGWTLHIDWLVAAGIYIAAGEFVESTYYIIVLKWADRTGRLVLSR
jgi:hypothetical protein